MNDTDRRRSIGAVGAARRAALLAVLSLLIPACSPPDRGTARAVDAPAFDADRAYTLLERQVGFGPRVPGEPGHDRQLDWMEAYLRARADTVVLRPFVHETGDGTVLRLTNVLARFRPEATDRVLLLAHWDTRPTADEDPDPDRRGQPIAGANDGASGTAVLLQLAEVLSNHSAPIGVDLLFVDGEDYAPDEMFLGSTHFAANLPPGYRPFYGVLVDMVADRTPEFPIEGYSGELAPAIVRRVWRVADAVGFGDRFVDRPGPYVNDDHVPLNRAGIPTIDIIDFEYGPGNRHWHTGGDTLGNTGPEGLRAVGTVLAALIYRGG